VGYLSKATRKKRIPPIILLERNSIIPKEAIFHEIGHAREDEDGWLKIKTEAMKLLVKTLVFATQEEPDDEILIYSIIRRLIEDFFVYEKMCQYGLFKEIIKLRENTLHEELFTFDLKIPGPLSAIKVAFATTLPKNFPSKEEEEKKLEGIIISRLRCFSKELFYQKIKSVVSKLESPPKVENIYKVGSEIIKLAQEFLSK
jgi:hypothetical protein